MYPVHSYNQKPTLRKGSVKMNLKTAALLMLGLIQGAISLNVYASDDERRTRLAAQAKFFDVLRCKAKYVWRDGFGQGRIDFLVSLKNVYKSPLKVYVKESQFKSYSIFHEVASNCRYENLSGVPLTSSNNEDEVRSEAIYIRPGEVVNIVYILTRCIPPYKMNKYVVLKNGTFSGSVTIILGSRFMNRPISCDF